jgi:hypothetical protein
MSYAFLGEAIIAIRLSKPDKAGFEYSVSK